MKKHLSVLIFLLFPVLLMGQRVDGNSVQLGFSATPTIGWLKFNDGGTGVSSNGGRAGFSYGILADFGLAGNQNYYFSSAFTITTVNGRARTSAPAQLYPALQPVPNEADYVFKIQYIEVPLTLKLKTNPTETGRFYGQFGLGTAVKIGAKSDVTASNIEQKNANISSHINNFRLSLIAGGGAEWRLNNLNLQTGITFNNGFTDILDGNGDAKNSYFALNLGLFF